VTPERYALIKAAFLDARERPRPEREAAVDARVRGDAELRREALAMLAADEDAEGFLEPPASPGSWPESLGRDRGYSVLAEIGRGGSGVVFLAERVDGDFTRRVALKLLPRVPTSPEAGRRFRRERRILAGLVHPHIARLLDDGSAEDGAPYLVMEHVEGVPLLEYARGIDLRARLRLFLAIGDAVAYAHRQLVVHRDLKPANILVTADGQPKLLDFGISKLLSDDPDEALTQEGRQPLTLRYASPEQLRGEVVTISTDVYSLGVILYELLSDRSPYDFELDAHADRTILQAVPVPPSARLAACAAGDAARLARARRLRGDLDAICMRALEKQSAERYESVERLAADVRRYLEGLPVHARRSHRLYRARKFARRHWLALTAAGAFLGLAMAFTLVQRSQLRATAAQRDRAERLSGLLVDLFKASDPTESAGRAPDLKVLLARGAERVRQDESMDRETRAALLQSVGRVYLNLGDLAAARAHLEQALTLRRAASPRSSEVAELLNDIAVVRNSLGDVAGAGPLVREALAIRRGRGEKDTRGMANLQNSLAILMDKQGRHEEADAAFAEALAIRRRRLPDDEPDYANALKNRSVALTKRRRFPEAEAGFREAIEIMRRLYPQGHRDLLRTLGSFAVLKREQGQYVEAERLFGDAIESGRRLLGSRHPEVTLLLSNYATLLWVRGRFEQSEAALREALASDRAALPDGHPHIDREAADLGRLLSDMGRDAEARPFLNEALERRRRRLGPEHVDVAHVEANLGRVECRGAAKLHGLRLLEASLARLRTASDVEPWMIAQSEGWLAECLARHGRKAEARDLYQRALPVLEQQYGDTDPARRIRQVLSTL
jgi:eukaryotic-like serine/threonine-protein kinase